ncbi:MAG: HAMP domain-containing sensor histidine kinase [Tissierellaceae bacterium]
MKDKQMSTVDIATQEYVDALFGLSETMFHDFKNILAIISGLSQLAALDVTSVGVRENLDTINKAALDCKDIIDKFYGFIKGYNTEYKENMVFGNIVLNSLNMVKHKINSMADQSNRIELSLNINSLSKVYCNEYKIKQALLNILLNAIEAMEEKGGTLGINLYEGGEFIFLEIWDTGVGIPEENIDKIFMHKFTTKGENGTGLGLKISKDIFENHGGEISVLSKLGVGTKFTITLPIAEAGFIEIC